MPLYPPVYPSARILRNVGLDATTAGTAALEDLDSYTVPAGLMANNGDCLHLLIEYEALANTNSLQVAFGGVTINNQNDQTGVGPFIYESVLRRTGAATGRYQYTLHYPNSVEYVPATIPLTPTWANALALVSRLRCHSAISDAFLRRVFVAYVPAVS